jgi:hypothetical protein
MQLIGQGPIDGNQRPALRCSCGQWVVLPCQPKDDGISVVVCNGCGMEFVVEVRIEGPKQ